MPARSFRAKRTDIAPATAHGRTEYPTESRGFGRRCPRIIVCFIPLLFIFCFLLSSMPTPSACGKPMYPRLSAEYSALPTRRTNDVCHPPREASSAVSSPSSMVVTSLARFACWLHNGCVTTAKMRMSRYSEPRSRRGTIWTVPFDLMERRCSRGSDAADGASAPAPGFAKKSRTSRLARSSSSYHCQASLMDPQRWSFKVGPFSLNDRSFTWVPGRPLTTTCSKPYGEPPGRPGQGCPLNWDRRETSHQRKIEERHRCIVRRFRDQYVGFRFGVQGLGSWVLWFRFYVRSLGIRRMG